MLFQWSDCDPPIRFKVPFRSSGSLATIVVAFLSSAAVFFVLITVLITESSFFNAHRRKSCDGISLSSSMPFRPAIRMEPGVTTFLGAEGPHQVGGAIAPVA